MRQAERRKFHYIYKTTCLITNRYYFGMHSTDNLEDGYIGSGQRLWHSIKKYGRENHSCEVVEFLESREALRTREREIVNEEMLKDSQCMNLIMGGGAFDLTPDQYQSRNVKCGAAKAKKMVESPELRKMYSEMMGETNRKFAKDWSEKNPRFTGKSHSFETKEQQSLRAKERVGEKHPCYGKHWIFNLEQNKKVDKDSLQSYLDLGWKKGRKGF